MSCDRILSATGSPAPINSAAWLAASSGFAARIDDTIGIPYAANKAEISSGSSQTRRSISAPSIILRAALRLGENCSGILGGVCMSASRLAPAHDMHESPYRLGFGRVVRDARGLKRALGKVIRADP